MEQARHAGAHIVKRAGKTFWGGYAGYFQDPDGHLWEVAWNPQMPMIDRIIEPHRRGWMSDYRSIEQGLSQLLKLPRRPVAVTFAETPPAAVAKFSGTEPSGCSFWRIASERADLLYRGERPSQLPDRQLYASSRPSAGACPGARPDADLHGRGRLHQDGRGGRHSAPCPAAGRSDLCPARRHAG